MDNFGARTSTESNRKLSAQATSHCALLASSEQHHAPFARLSIVNGDHSHAPSSAEATSPETSSPRFSPETLRRQMSKCHALDEMIDREAESKKTQGDEICRPDIPEGAVGSTPVLSYGAREAETPQDRLRQGKEHHKEAVAALPLRMSTRRTKTTTRWSPSVAGGRHQSSHRTSNTSISQPSWSSSASPGVTPPPPNRPILNATQNISFDMLQPHFERPLQQAADTFCVCTTLLKKICRRNGINNWPYRKICGLRKSIASMTKQVNYFDGEQRRAYADQLKKLEYELQAYLRTGNEPMEELFQNVDVEAAVEQLKQDTTETDERNEAQMVSTCSTGITFKPPRYKDVYELPSRPFPSGDSCTTWGDTHFRPREQQQLTPAFSTTATVHRALPSIASILQHQNYSSPSRAASLQSPSITAPGTWYYEMGFRHYQQPQWRYFPPTNDDAK